MSGPPPPSCVPTSCVDDCCNYHGSCPSDFNPNNYSTEYTECHTAYPPEYVKHGGQRPNIKLIVGLTVGLSLLLIIIIGVIVYIKKRNAAQDPNNKDQKNGENLAQDDTSATGFQNQPININQGQPYVIPPQQQIIS